MFVFERETLFPGSDGEVPEVTLLPVPLILYSSLQDPVGTSAAASGPSCESWWHPWGWGLSPVPVAWGAPGLLCLFSKASGLESRW